MPISSKPTDEFVCAVRQLIDARKWVDAEEQLRDRIFSDPLDVVAFELLSELRAHTGNKEVARVTDLRLRQLRQIAENSKLAHTAEQYRGVLADLEHPSDTIEVHGFRFSGLRLHRNAGQLCIVGCSLDGCAFLKIELQLMSENAAGLAGETKFLRKLTDSGSVCTAALLADGSIRPSELGGLPAYKEGSLEFPLPSTKKPLPYVVLSYIRADRGGFGVADVVLALLEQQALGIYQNCLSLSKIRFDSLQGVCRFTDYRSAVLLDASIRRLSAVEYIQWCIEREEERVLGGGSPSFFQGRSEEISRLFQEDQFLLVRTQLFGRQRIADMPIPCIQYLHSDRFVLQGSVPVADRIELLNKLRFQPGERALDLGCGAGAISRYLAGLECEVTGVDCDVQLVLQSRLLANLERDTATFIAMDLEYEFPSGRFDTVLGLGLFPHIIHRPQLAKRIVAALPKRIILECSLAETGYRWQGSIYHRVEPPWGFCSIEELKYHLLDLFSDYLEVSEIGSSSTHRTVFLLQKKDASAR